MWVGINLYNWILSLYKRIFVREVVKYIYVPTKTEADTALYERAYSEGYREGVRDVETGEVFPPSPYTSEFLERLSKHLDGRVSTYYQPKLVGGVSYVYIQMTVPLISKGFSEDEGVVEARFLEWLDSGLKNFKRDFLLKDVYR